MQVRVNHFLSFNPSLLKTSAVLKASVIGLVSLGLSNFAQAENCQLTSQITVRAAPDGNTIGQLKSATAIRVVDYTLDSRGRSWAYIYWQGQPLKTPYNGNYNAGWVSRDAIRCQ